jgi:uncharacterized membrane protein
MTTGAQVDVSVSRFVPAPPERVRGIMFDPRQDPGWMAAVKSVEPQGGQDNPGARVRRTGTFLGRTLRWTTEVVATTPNRLELRIIDGPMRGTVTYRVEPSGSGSQVSIRNTGEAAGWAPRWLLAWAMRRSLAADLRRLEHLLEVSP